MVPLQLPASCSVHSAGIAGELVISCSPCMTLTIAIGQTQLLEEVVRKALSNAAPQSVAKNSPGTPHAAAAAGPQCPKLAPALHHTYSGAALL